jgi:orotate phosphoribosyltransferase
MERLRALTQGGLAAAPPAALDELAQECWRRGIASGDARYVVLAEVFQDLHGWWHENGAMPRSVVNELDALFRGSLGPVLDASSPHDGAQGAHELLRDVQRVSENRSAAPPTAMGTDVVARVLVDTGAVAFRTDPFFTFTSGMESPVYVDNRRLLGYPVERRKVVSEFLNAVSGAPAAIAGTATAGIPWAAWIAERLDLPMLYVRSQAKSWGQQRAIEGAAPDGAHVVLVEDLAFTAGSLTASAASLRDAGYQVDAAMTIVSYDTPQAAERIAETGLEHRSLTTIDAALIEAQRQGTLDTDQVGVVRGWLKDIRRG